MLLNFRRWIGLGQQQNDKQLTCLSMWTVFDKWAYKRNLKSLCVVLLVMKPLNVWHLAHQGCTCIAAPLMVWHPFRSPLSTFQTCSHYFQQLFLQQMPRKIWQEKYTEWAFFLPPKRSTVCHFIMFIHPAEWKFQRGKNMIKTWWEPFAVSLCVWKSDLKTKGCEKCISPARFYTYRFILWW